MAEKGSLELAKIDQALAGVETLAEMLFTLYSSLKEKHMPSYLIYAIVIEAARAWFARKSVGKDV